MHAKLINCLGCVIGEIKEESDQAALAKIAAEWMAPGILQKGDKIVIVSVEEDDPMDDFNYVGSKHHY